MGTQCPEVSPTRGWYGHIAGRWIFPDLLERYSGFFKTISRFAPYFFAPALRPSPRFLFLEGACRQGWVIFKAGGRVSHLNVDAKIASNVIVERMKRLLPKLIHNIQSGYIPGRHFFLNNKLFSFFTSRCFLKEIENMFSVFLSSYRNTSESLGELEKAVETCTRLRLVFPQHFSFSQTSTRKTHNALLTFITYITLYNSTLIILLTNATQCIYNYESNRV